MPEDQPSAYIDPIPRCRNKFLASLAADDFELIRPHLRTAELRQEQMLLQMGDIFRHIYFPHDGVISLVLPLSRGEVIEIAMVGRDGVLGVFAALGEPVSLCDIAVLIPGTASILDVEHLRAATGKSSRSRTVSITHQPSLIRAGPANRWLQCRAPGGGSCGALAVACTRPP
jgi:CRP-like cAMP-binding protein